MPKPKLAVIGASHFQLPLIERAKEMGCEVHAFAWECGDVGEDAADVFHPVSIVEHERIVEECREMGVQGICTIASDLATVAVCHVAAELGLAGNSIECMHTSTNKLLMREAFAKAGDPSPKSLAFRLVDAERAMEPECADDARAMSQAELEGFDPLTLGLEYPLIVKPADRSGSRGVTKLEAPGVPVTASEALREAFEQSFVREAVVEEFAEGDEFSVESMSWEGTHHVLAVTRKGTTGAPHFIETAHLEPPCLPDALIEEVRNVTEHALDTLGVTCGASHTELKIADDGTIRIIEIGARMGGDCIGTHLVPLSCGVDFVGAVVSTALGKAPDLTPAHAPAAAAVRFLFDEDDIRQMERIQRERPDLVRYACRTNEADGHEVTDSSSRLGHYVLQAADVFELEPYLPDEFARIVRGERA